MCCRSVRPFSGPIDVQIPIAERSLLSCVFPVPRSAHRGLDNCFRDQAATNARQLADLLNSADIRVVSWVS
jgi:hypothetical protein